MKTIPLKLVFDIGLIDFWRIFEKWQFLVITVRINRTKFQVNFHILKLAWTKSGIEESGQ